MVTLTLKSAAFCASLLFFLGSCHPDIDYIPLTEAVELQDFSEITNLKTSGRKESADFLVLKAELLFVSRNDASGKVILYHDTGNKQMDYTFSPQFQLDSSLAITYHIDVTRSFLPIPESHYVSGVENAMKSWENVNCSEIVMEHRPSLQEPTGFVAWSAGFGGSPAYVADINHAGFMPGEFFNLFDPNGAVNILGITFTIAARDGRGLPIDIDQDGKFDVAFREIYYNRNHDWTTAYDFLSVALHETGHGLSQAHFGKAFRTGRNGPLKFAPRSLMNASYSGVYRNPAGPDLGGHCSLWANWPSH